MENHMPTRLNPLPPNLTTPTSTSHVNTYQLLMSQNERKNEFVIIVFKKIAMT